MGKVRDRSEIIGESKNGKKDQNSSSHESLCALSPADYLDSAHDSIDGYREGGESAQFGSRHQQKNSSCEHDSPADPRSHTFSEGSNPRQLSGENRDGKN